MGQLSRFFAMHWLALAGAMALFGHAAAQEVATGDLAERAQTQLPQDAEQLGIDGLEEADEALEASAPVEIRYDRYNTATLRALDKITGRSTDIDVTVDKPVIFGSLRVTLKSCHQTPPELPPESAAFLEVDSVQAVQATVAAQAEEAERVDQDTERLFSGWMFASSPGLSALEHPVYDIWTIRCTTSAPVSGASGG